MWNPCEQTMSIAARCQTLVGLRQQTAALAFDGRQNDKRRPRRSDRHSCRIWKHHEVIRRQLFTPKQFSVNSSGRRLTRDPPVWPNLHYTDTDYGHVVQHHQRTSSQQVVDVVQHVRSRLNLLYNILLWSCKWPKLHYTDTGYGLVQHHQRTSS